MGPICSVCKSQEAEEGQRTMGRQRAKGGVRRSDAAASRLSVRVKSHSKRKMKVGRSPEPLGATEGAKKKMCVRICSPSSSQKGSEREVRGGSEDTVKGEERRATGPCGGCEDGDVRE